MDPIDQPLLSLSYFYPNEISDRLQHEQNILLEKKENWKVRKDFRYRIENNQKMKIEIPIPKFGQLRQRNIQLFIGRWTCILAELRKEYPKMEIQLNTFGQDEEIKEIVKKVY